MGAMVAISHCPHELYRKSLSTWRNISFQSQTRKGTATEILYMNYPEPKDIRDYRYLGVDNRERERIKKKFRFITDKVENIPPLLRSKFFKHIADRYDI